MMNRFQGTLAVWATVLCSACSVSIDVTEEDVDAVVEADFQGDCRGQGSETNAFGTVNYVKDDSTGACQVDLTWSGPLVDMAPIRAEVEEDADIADVELEEIEIHLRLVHIEDSQGAVVETPTLTNFTGTVSIGGVPIYAIDGSTVDALLAPEGLVVRFSGESDPVVQAINGALQAGATLQAAAEARLTMSSVLPLQTNNPHRIVFRHNLRLTASASVLF